MAKKFLEAMKIQKKQVEKVVAMYNAENKILIDSSTSKY